MVVIRLARGGAKKRPFYNIVATDSRSSRDGRFIERVGFYKSGGLRRRADARPQHRTSGLLAGERRQAVADRGSPGQAGRQGCSLDPRGKRPGR